MITIHFIEYTAGERKEVATREVEVPLTEIIHIEDVGYFTIEGANSPSDYSYVKTSITHCR